MADDPIAIIKAKLFDAWLTSNEIPRARLEAWAAGDEEIPEPLVRELELVLGVPAASWKRVARVYSLKSGASLPKSVYSGAVQSPANDSGSGAGRPPRRVARKIYDAFRARGYSSVQKWVEKVGDKRGITYSALATWIQGRFRIPVEYADFMQRSLGIPLEAWDDVFQAHHRRRAR